ncbi:hypothetical protein NUU61_001750 [Penicillium alfredii]|uniref:BZIP domain-containing protein n=1 Tax=Penicillium alfredii TaxID=1506179 RepID=A0A9W9FQF1_9EURO|nr:uncharacterized protein NUU61_001750 [Penicillium alfredii]KAJ5104403.1 hypothetical protein NUU61_001750 [Penicillium alfredii]
MKAERKQEASSGDELPQKQDPLERRRLQNRLDRIAKLQERVIANELRAAAALNGWDQAYTTSTRHTLHDSECTFNSQNTSPLDSEPSTPYIPPSALSPPSWPSDFPSFLSPSVFTGIISSFDATPAMDSITSPLPAPMFSSSTTITQSPTNHMGGHAFQDMATSGPMTPESASFPPNQPLYYLATEATLPQILQAINTMSPQSQIIVLVPQDSSSSVGHNAQTSSLNGENGFENPFSPTQVNSQSVACQCQSYNILSGSTHPAISRTWSVPGSFVPVCPLHKMQESAMGNCSVMML